MIKLLKTKKKYALALKVVDGFTLDDENYCELLFEEKLNKGNKQVNLLIQVDELRVTKSSMQAFVKDLFWILRKYKRIGHLAIVAHSKVIKAWIEADNLLFRNIKKGRHEIYFDVSQMKEAMAFVNSRG